jgi:hypothetical protein
MSAQLPPLSQRGDEESHESLRSQLPAYAILCLQGEPDPGEWQPLTRHLAGCAGCREELDELILMLNDTASGADVADEDLPAFDLASLPPFADRQRNERQTVAPGSAAARRGVQLDLSGLLAALQRPQRADGLSQHRADGPDLPAIHHEVRLGPPDALDIALDLAPSDRERSIYRLTLSVVQANDSFAQGRHQVTLVYDDKSVAAITDEQGCVVFGDVPREALGTLRIDLQMGNGG